MHQIEFKDLQIFIKIAETSSFHEAAKLTFLSQPALSRRMQRLESLLGAKLLERTTRSTRLTPAGRNFLPQARNVLESFESSVLGIKDMAVHLKGRITIACIPTAAFYFLPSVIKVFNERYPLIRITIIDESANYGLEAVIRGDADFGINMSIAQHPEVSFTPLIDDPFVVCLTKDHPLAELDEVSWKELEHYKLISVSRNSGNRILLDKSIARDKVNLNSFYEVQHLSTSLGLVETGLGVSIVPKLAMPLDINNKLTYRPLSGESIDRTIGLVKRSSSPVSATAELFIEILLDKWKY